MSQFHLQPAMDMARAAHKINLRPLGNLSDLVAGGRLNANVRALDTLSIADADLCLKRLSQEVEQNLDALSINVLSAQEKDIAALDLRLISRGLNLIAKAANTKVAPDLINLMKGCLTKVSDNLSLELCHEDIVDNNPPLNIRTTINISEDQIIANQQACGMTMLTIDQSIDLPRRHKPMDLVTKPTPPIRAPRTIYSRCDVC